MNDRKLNGISYETIRQWFESNGRSTLAIAQTLGCTRQRVSQVLRAQGVDVAAIGFQIRHANIARRMAARVAEAQLLRLENQSYRRKTKEQRYARMIALWEAGKSSTEIATATKCKVATVREAIRRLRIRYGWFPKRKRCNLAYINN